MRVGVDGRKISRAQAYGPLKSFEHAREPGLEGLFFRTVLEMSPTLDHGELREIKAHADSLGMYVESGLGKVNPSAIWCRRSWWCIGWSTRRSATTSRR